MHIRGILETCLYARDLDAAEAFYTGILGLEVSRREAGRHVFLRCGGGVLLLFNPDRTSTEVTTVQGSPIPLHGARGPGHLAFDVRAAELPAWRAHLVRKGVVIESEVHWPRGGASIYFRDPADNSLELTSASIWGLWDD